MEDIKVDVKLIIIPICISTILGTLIWAGYNLYVKLTKDENEEVEYFEGNTASSINKINSVEYNENDTDFNVSDIIGEDGFEINNTNIEPKKEGWSERRHNFIQSGNRTIYYIPSNWKSDAISDEKNGTTIDAHMLKINNLTKETTYEEFLNKFIETIETFKYEPHVENYSKRKIDIDGQTFYVLVEEVYYNGIYEYFCLAKDEYAYYLKVRTTKEKYNQELINSVDEIFATFRIIK